MKKLTHFILHVTYVSPIPVFYDLLLTFYVDDYAAFDLPDFLIFPDTYYFPLSLELFYFFHVYIRMDIPRNKYRFISLKI